jgi:hypothetical protein
MSSKSDIMKYAAQSAFIFSGKVIKSRAATMKDIASSNTVIMEIIHVMTAPTMFAHISGQQITVRFKKPPPLKTGQVLTVFANGWIFGESIAVDAVGFTIETAAKIKSAKSAMSGKSEMASVVQTALAESNDAVLKERLNSAAMGVVGEVMKVKESAIKTTFISEHNPNWQEAIIKVDDVVKGKKGIKQIKILFPASDDIRWKKTNKYKKGQKGIWMVQKGKKQSAKGIGAKAFAAIPPGDNVYTTLHQSDFMPLNELSRIKSLVKK